MKIIGWIHTHPDYGIFLSENDMFIQNNYFKDINQVAYVIDPIQKEE
jgi:proteasome lid subunit RPN8/RPN11